MHTRPSMCMFFHHAFIMFLVIGTHPGYGALFIFLLKACRSFHGSFHRIQGSSSASMETSTPSTDASMEARKLSWKRGSFHGSAEASMETLETSVEASKIPWKLPASIAVETSSFHCGGYFHGSFHWKSHRIFPVIIQRAVFTSTIINELPITSMNSRDFHVQVGGSFRGSRFHGDVGSLHGDFSGFTGSVHGSSGSFHGSRFHGSKSYFHGSFQGRNESLSSHGSRFHGRCGKHFHVLPCKLSCKYKQVVRKTGKTVGCPYTRVTSATSMDASQLARKLLLIVLPWKLPVLP